MLHFQGPRRRDCLPVNSDRGEAHHSYAATPQKEDEAFSSEAEYCSSDSSSSDSDEDDSVNERLRPFWAKYQRIFSEHNLHLDTVRDVKGSCVQRPFQSGVNDDALCPDPGLVSSFYRRQDPKLKFKAYASPTAYFEGRGYWIDGDSWQKLSMLVVGNMK